MSYFRRLRSPKSLIIVLSAIPLALLLITAWYTPSPWALSPVGVIVVAAYAILPIVVLARKLKRMRIRSRTASVALLLLLGNPTQFGPLPPQSKWQTAVDSVTLMGNEWAWQAATDIDLRHGWAGIAPAFYRPVVPGYPITMITTHDPTLNAAVPYSLHNGFQHFSLAQPPAIVNTIPNQALNVNRFLFVSDTGIDPAALNGMLIRTLEAGCQTCAFDASLEIHPLYATKLAIDGAIMYVGVYDKPLGKILGKLDEALNPYLQPDWNLRLNTTSAGSTNMTGSNFTWFTDATSTYSGSIMDGQWTISTNTRSHLVQTYGPMAAPIDLKTVDFNSLPRVPKLPDASWADPGWSNPGSPGRFDGNPIRSLPDQIQIDPVPLKQFDLNPVPSLPKLPDPIQINPVPAMPTLPDPVHINPAPSLPKFQDSIQINPVPSMPTLPDLSRINPAPLPRFNFNTAPLNPSLTNPGAFNPPAFNPPTFNAPSFNMNSLNTFTMP